MAQKIVITGGAGFIGSHIAEEALKNDFEVTVIDNLSSGSYENMKTFLPRIRFVEGSIFDLGLLKREFAGADFISHQAAVVSVSRSVEHPIETNDINMRGTLNVFEAAKEAKVKKVVYASSTAIYGDEAGLPKREDMPGHPLSPYAFQKYSTELYAGVFNKVHNLPTIGLRYFNVFGERQGLDGGYPAVVPIFIKQILGGIQPIIYGDGESTRDFIYVKNVAEANILACKSAIGGEIFNIGSGVETSINQLFERLAALLGAKVKPKYEEARKGDIRRSVADIEKAKKMIGFTINVDFEEGLRRSINYYSNINQN